MALFSISSYLSTLILLSLLKILAANSDSLFSFNGFGKDRGFQSSIALHGDAKVVNDSSSVQLTGSGSSAGRMIYKKPIKLVEEGKGKNRNWVSFSTNFTFSITRGNGDGLAFVMLPRGFNASVFGNSSFGLSLEMEKSKNRVVGVEFDTSMDVKYGDLNDNHVGIDVGSLVSVKAKNLSSAYLVLKGGVKLQSWIDYEAGSKRLEVRLSQSGLTRPVEPLLSCPIDLSKMWKDEVFVGLSSSNKNSSQNCFVHSWSFKLRRIRQWMHSEPLDPNSFINPVSVKHKTVEKRSVCIERMLAAMIIGTACGALGASIFLYLWTVFGNRSSVVPEEEYAVHPMDFEYKKVELIVDKTIEGGKN